jgi:metallophosphoesterase superfamily enzyme
MLIEAKDIMVVQVLDAFTIQALAFDHCANHLNQNGIIGTHHHPKVDVSTNFVDENRVN